MQRAQGVRDREEESGSALAAGDAMGPVRSMPAHARPGAARLGAQLPRDTSAASAAAYHALRSALGLPVSKACAAPAAADRATSPGATASSTRTPRTRRSLPWSSGARGGRVRVRVPSTPNVGASLRNYAATSPSAPVVSNASCLRAPARTGAEAEAAVDGLQGSNRAHLALLRTTWPRTPGTRRR